MHGQGKWDPDEVYTDVNTLAAVLGILGCIVKEAGEDLFDSKLNLRPRFRALARKRLKQMFGSTEEANLILDIEGWN